MRHNLFHSLQTFPVAGGRTGEFYSLPQLEKEGVGPVSRLPFSIRILLESVLRNCDGKRIRKRMSPDWRTGVAKSARTEEVPFVVARILLQDFTGVPLLVDLAAMRSAVQRLGGNAGIIEPLVPVDLIIDHSVQVDYFGSADALQLNMDMEIQRNHARYRFLKWGMQGFRGFNVIPPGVGICHQVNLEYLAKVVQEKEGLYYPDTLVGTDSHTTMINGLGILGWGVGGIEAEAGMLGQPVYFLTPDVIGVRLSVNSRKVLRQRTWFCTSRNFCAKPKLWGNLSNSSGRALHGCRFPIGPLSAIWRRNMARRLRCSLWMKRPVPICGIRAERKKMWTRFAITTRRSRCLARLRMAAWNTAPFWN